jgi:hypothetical protein
MIMKTGDKTSLGSTCFGHRSSADHGRLRAEPGSEKSLNPELAGQWNGALQINDAQLRLVLKISKAADGSLTATMDSPDQGAKDLPVTAILFNNPAFKLEMEAIGATFNGNLNRKAEIA